MQGHTYFAIKTNDPDVAYLEPLHKHEGQTEWWPCDGRSFSAFDFPRLAHVLGFSYGREYGNPRIPDLRVQGYVNMNCDER